MKQRAFSFPNNWGGRRKGAGPKRKGARELVSHREREALASRFPVLVTMRLREGLPSLRRKPALRLLRCAFGAAEKGGFRVVHYSVQSNHLHLVVEGKDRRSLSRGMQGLGVRIARRLNRMWGRVGSVFADRYHDRILRSPREVFLALRYVLRNAIKHGILRQGVDPFSSEAGNHVCEARTWLLGYGWRKGLRFRS